MDELGQITLTQAAGIGMSILLTLALVAMWKIGIPLASEWWQRRQHDRLSTDSRETASLERSTPVVTRMEPTAQVMSRGSARHIRARQIVGVRRVAQRRKLEAEARSRSAKQALERDIKDRQLRGLVKYAALPKTKGKVEIVDSILPDLMGLADKTVFAELRKARDEQAEIARIKSLPRDPELEQMTPLPT